MPSSNHIRPCRGVAIVTSQFYVFVLCSSVDVRLEAGKCVKVNVKIADVLGELILGKLDQEYIKDPDLRELLDMTALDVKRMESLEEQKLRLIYSVIYSEKFELKGKREHEVFILVLISSLSGCLKLIVDSGYSDRIIIFMIEKGKYRSTRRSCHHGILIKL